MARYGAKRSKDFDLIAFTGELFASQRRRGIFASSEFVFPLLSLLMVDGTVKSLEPDLDFQSLARPLVLDVIDEQAAASA